MNSDDMKKEENASEAGISAPEQEKQDASLAVAGTGMPDVTDGDTQTEREVSVSDEVKAKQQPEKEVLKPGAQLAAFRVAAGIEQEQVAASLKMTIRQVRELEADHYEALHGVAISRGFVRAYAKMLQVDPEPLVAMFAKEDPVTASKQLDQIPRRDASTPFMQGSQPFGRKRGGGRIIWLILIIVAVVLAAGYGVRRFAPVKKTDQVAETAVQASAPQTASSGNSAPEIVVADPEKTQEATDKATDGKAPQDAEKPVQPEGETEAQGTEVQGTEVQGDEKAEKPAGQDVTQNQQENKNEPEQAQPEKMPVASAEAPGNVLTVHFSGPSRIQVLKADASVLQELDGKSGDVHQLEIHEPVTLVVEKALNVQAEFRKQPLALRTARRSPEARIELK